MPAFDLRTDDYNEGAFAPKTIDQIPDYINNESESCLIPSIAGCCVGDLLQLLNEHNISYDKKHNRIKIIGEKNTIIAGISKAIEETQAKISSAFSIPNEPKYKFLSMERTGSN